MRGYELDTVYFVSVPPVRCTPYCRCVIIASYPVLRSSVRLKLRPITVHRSPNLRASDPRTCSRFMGARVAASRASGSAF